MVKNNILPVVFLIVLSSFSSALYDEPYRPQFHFSPPSGWMNDPNGLVYYDGLFHLFYQHNPVAPIHDNIHWGHAVSPDMVHWKNLAVAIAPYGKELIYSGSSIIDHNNVTGLQFDDHIQPLIAIFTAYNNDTGEQKQWLAYSNEGPEYEHFQYYNYNPIIPNPNPSVQKDFRDPAVFQFNNHYVQVVAAHDHIMIYNSLDLLEWKLVSEFGMDQGSHIGTWECPSLFPINVTINGLDVEKWVLIVGLTDFAIPTTQYYIGSFDGQTFINENSEETVLWLEYGPDSFAGITYNQLADGRRPFISWMNRWQYSKSFNFTAWNGQMGLARELKLTKIGNEIRLSSLPVREVQTLRINPVRRQNVTITNAFVFNIVEHDDEQSQHQVDVEMTLDVTNLKAGDSFNIVFFDKKDSIKISFKANAFILDRSNAGRTDFPNFGLLWKAPRFIKSCELKLRIVVDRSSIEFFAMMACLL
uniref:MDL4 n=1 Tax=Mayetiola destructor TaxID=39758 RepID=A0A7S5VKT6_MAYDE|nr:MDL4 [Mayetiola destructor]